MLLVALLLSLSQAAFAQSRHADAITHAQKARKLLTEASYAEAAEELRQAYKVSPDPTYLYGRAECIYFLWACEGSSGHRNEARSLFRRYLDQAPVDADERGGAETYLRRLDADDRPPDPGCKAVEVVAAKPAGRTDSGGREHSDLRRVSSIWVAGGAALMLVGGTALLLAAEARYSSAHARGCGTSFTCPDDANAMRIMRVVGGVALAGSLAAGAVAAFLYLGGQPEGQVAVSADFRSVSIARVWRF